MEDEYDECEYVWIHEIAMRRLLNLLRQSQAHCTQNECLTEVSGSLLPREGDNTNNDMMFFIMMIWFIIALILFFLRPNSMRSRERKNHLTGSGPDRDPPPAIN